MNIKLGLSILGLAVALGCGGGGGSSNSASTPPPGPPANTVWVGGSSSDPYGGGNTTFNPATLTVTAGTQVSFVWKGGAHTVTSYAVSSSPTFPGVPNPGQSSGTYTYTFANAGTYYYRCEYHSTAPVDSNSVATGMMIGKVVVN